MPIKNLSKIEFIIWPNGEIINLRKYLMNQLELGVKFKQMEFLISYIKKNCNEINR